MQTDGNFVIYSSTMTALWWTGTNGLFNSWLSLQNDGRILLIATNGTTAWASR